MKQTFPKAWCGSVLVLALASAAMTSQAADALPNFVSLVENNSAAVVNIRTSPKGGASRSNSGLPEGIPELPEDNPLGDLFKHFLERMPDTPPRQGRRSLGSGFVISADGYVLTNAHVVKDAEHIRVGLSDNREKEARLIGIDERTDLALLKVDGERLPAVRLGDSDRLAVGEWVLAIGSPFGLEHTATQGIVSALGRSLPSESYVPFIQTDVAVNPGNSGGPLFNTRGEVIGINSQIYSQTGGYMGLSFAIPVNVAMKVVDELKTDGRVTYGWLGVLIQPVSQQLAESFGLDRPRGALVARVTPDGPAARAGVKAGDVILSFDGTGVETSSELPPLVGSSPVGTKVSMTVVRQGSRKTLRVTLGELDDRAARQASSERMYGAVEVLGLGLSNLTASEREELEVGERGVMVEKVGDGAGSKAGLRPGDVILAINHRDVRDVDAFTEEIERLPDGAVVPLLIQRDADSRFLALRLPG